MLNMTLELRYTPEGFRIETPIGVRVVDESDPLMYHTLHELLKYHHTNHLVVGTFDGDDESESFQRLRESQAIP